MLQGDDLCGTFPQYVQSVLTQVTCDMTGRYVFITSTSEFSVAEVEVFRVLGKREYHIRDKAPVQTFFFFFFLFTCMFYQLLGVQHSCSSTPVVETRDQNSRGCPLLFSNRNLGSFCA